RRAKSCEKIKPLPSWPAFSSGVSQDNGEIGTQRGEIGSNKPQIRAAVVAHQGFTWRGNTRSQKRQMPIEPLRTGSVAKQKYRFGGNNLTPATSAVSEGVQRENPRKKDAGIGSTESLPVRL